jgi:hypothetical protein
LTVLERFPCSSAQKIDYLRAVDKQRIVGRFGVLAGPELESLDLGLRLFLGL